MSQVFTELLMSNCWDG